MAAVLCPPLAPGVPASATPALATPSAPICGVADPATVSAPATPAPSNAFTVVAQGFPASALVVSGSSLYVLDVSALTIRRFTLDGAVIGSVSLSWGLAAPAFAVDETGNIYLVRWPSTLVKLSPTGGELWSRELPTGISGVYGIGTGAGFRVGLVSTATSSLQYDADGNSTGTSAITGTAFSPAPDGGIVATDGRYVRRYSAAGVEQTVFGDVRGAADMQASGGPYHFIQQGGAAVDASGNFYIPDATRGIHGATPKGYHRGLVDDLTAGYVTERSWIAPAVTASGERRFYFLSGGRFNANQKVSWVREVDLASLVASPRTFKDRALGFGAGLSSSAVGQYFPAGTTPSVRASFDPWWVAGAGGLSLRYTVRDRYQTINQQAVAPVTIPLPTTAAGLASISLTLPPAVPGVYEVDAHLVDATGTVVGATCYRYAVGAPGHRLDFATLPRGSGYGGPEARRGVALAKQLGINALRATADWERLLPNGSTGAMDFTVHDSAFTAAAYEASITGVAFYVQLGSGLAREQQLVADGTWGARVKELVKHYHDAGVQISGWEVWSEPNNNFGPAADYVTKALAPAFHAIREGDPDSKVIGGTVLGMDLGYFEAMGEAGAYPMMDVVGMHPYTGHNRSLEEQGIPQNMRDLRTILARYGSGTKPVWNTESAWWSDGPANFFSQADKTARTLLWNRILGIERWSYLLLEAGYGDYGLTYSLIEAANSPDYVKAGALATMTADWQTADRPLLAEVVTGMPHTTAARFGSRPGGTDTVLAAWTDDIDVPANLVATTSAPSVQVTVTDVLGASSTKTLVPGTPSPISLGGSPVYLTAPAGATLSIAPPVAFGPNLAAANAGATATATSATSTNLAAEAIDGLPSARLARTTSVDPAEGGNVNGIPAWASAPGDTTPALTVQLPQATLLDRVVVLTHSNGSINPGLRNYSLEVRGSDGLWANVGTAQNQFFGRGKLLSFAARTATAFRLTVSAVNYGGYAGGAPPWFWPTDAASQSNPSEVWYGPAVVYEVEAYGPGTIPPANANRVSEISKSAGSDTTYPVLNDLGEAFNESQGCESYGAVYGAGPDFEPTAPLTCAPDASQPSSSVVTENYDHDVVANYFPTGSTDGFRQLCRREAASVQNIQFARSSSSPSLQAPNCTTANGGDSGTVFRWVSFASENLGWARWTGGHSVTNLTVAQLQGIFVTCSITNWSQLGGPNEAIRVFAPQANSGSLATWESLLGGNATSCIPAAFKDGNPANGERLVREHQAIDVEVIDTAAEATGLETCAGQPGCASAELERWSIMASFSCAVWNTQPTSKSASQVGDVNGNGCAGSAHPGKRNLYNVFSHVAGAGYPNTSGATRRFTDLPPTFPPPNPTSAGYLCMPLNKHSKPPGDPNPGTAFAGAAKNYGMEKQAILQANGLTLHKDDPAFAPGGVTDPNEKPFCKQAQWLVNTTGPMTFTGTNQGLPAGS